MKLLIILVILFCSGQIVTTNYLPPEEITSIVNLQGGGVIDASFPWKKWLVTDGESVTKEVYGLHSAIRTFTSDNWMDRQFVWRNDGNIYDGYFSGMHTDDWTTSHLVSRGEKWFLLCEFDGGKRKIRGWMKGWHGMCYSLLENEKKKVPPWCQFHRLNGGDKIRIEEGVWHEACVRNQTMVESHAQYRIRDIPPKYKKYSESGVSEIY